MATPTPARDPADSELDGLTKGWPPGAGRLRLRDVGRQGWNVLREDLPLPVALLKQSALEHNSRWMRQFLALSGAKLCPHGKTTMSPQLFRRQLADGAWGITLATMQQVRVAREFGIERILLANELWGAPALNYLADELERDERFDFYCLVDSLAGVDTLAQAWRRRLVRRPLQVLVEVGVAGKRCGCRGVAASLEVARAVQRASPWLQLRGVEGFEGVITGATPAERDEQVRSYLAELGQVARQCAAESLFAPGRVLLTAGGSSFFDLVTTALSSVELPDVEVIVRSGCYLTHDSLVLQQLYEQLLERSADARRLGPGLRPALEVWAYVLSRPEPTRAVLSMGKRDCSFDADLPVPRWHQRPGSTAGVEQVAPDHRIIGLNDQHALVEIPSHSPWRVGDLVGCGISHPCTTFDRWQFLPLVDDDYQVVDAVRTYF